MARVLENLAVLLLLSVIVLRPLVAESYDSMPSAITQAIGDTHDPSPGHTLMLDLILLVGVVAGFAARLMDKTRSYRATGLEWGFAIVTVAAIISCFYASNTRLAINATLDWLCLPLVAMVLAQLLNTSERRRIVIAVILGGAVVQALQCFEQFLAFGDTWDQYLSMKSDFWARQGVELDSQRVELYERRILAGETSGFFPHPNVAASYLTLCLFPAIGLLVAYWPAKDVKRGIGRLLGTMALVAVILAALALTNSNGARISIGVCLALWLLTARHKAWFDGHRRMVLRLGWLGVVIGAAATIGHGLYHDKLPGWSLTFRWQYWKTSASMISDHGLTGVGRENFGRNYLAYKSIRSPEEVSNPHNLFVQAAADWGWLGLIGFLLMLYAVSAALIHRPSANVPDVTSNSMRGPPERVRFALWGGLIFVAVTVLRIPMLGTDDPNYVYYMSMVSGLGFGFAFLLAAWTLTRIDVGETLDRSLHTGVVFGLLAFLVHETINFALFVPGSATTFFALLGVALSSCPKERDPSGGRAPRWRWGAFGVSVASLVVVFTIGWRPVVRSKEALDQAESVLLSLETGTLQDQQAYAHLHRAMEADPLDPTPVRKYAQWLYPLTSISQLADQAWSEAEKAIEETITRDPKNVANVRTQMRFFAQRAKAMGMWDDYRAAIDAAKRVLIGYPQSPPDLAALGDRYREAAQDYVATSITPAARRVHVLGYLKLAEKNYEGALDLDQQRIKWEELHRLSPAETQAIQGKLAIVRKMMLHVPDNSEP